MSLSSPFLALIALSLAAAAETAPTVPAPAEATSAAPAPVGPPTGQAVKVYDGDTLTLSTGEKIRLRWVNTPELRPLEKYAVEARDAAFAFVAGKTIELHYAPSRDRYGRCIAEVLVDGQSLSRHLLSLGYGHLAIIPPTEGDHADLMAVQMEAKAAKRGIWSLPEYQGTFHISSFHANAAGDDTKNLEGEYFRMANLTDKPVDIEGYRVMNRRKSTYTLPSIVVPPGQTIEVHSGQGANQTDPTTQLKVYLQSTRPVYNNKGDEVNLFDPSGTLISSRKYEVKGKN